MTEPDDGVKTYMITGYYDGVNIPAFQQWLMDSVDILSYWNHLPFIFFVKTRIGLNSLTYKVDPFFNGSLYIVGEVQHHLLNGKMTKEAWQWFSAPAPHYKTSVPNSLASLFLPKP